MEPDTSRDELIYESRRTRIFRTRLPNGAGTVICKEPLGPDAAARTRHELGILNRLAGIEGVPRLVALPSKAAVVSNVIYFEDTDAQSLAEAVRSARLEPAALVEFAAQLTAILSAVHRSGVVHKDINPANILLSGSDRRPVLNDFDLATTLAADGTSPQPRILAGTLAYLAPEQTGRMGRLVDERADLYALGATFYELATGRTPFGESDALQSIHDHVARIPEAPAEIDPRVPVEFSRIVMRLLEKEPDRRYQSAKGLLHDLFLLRGRGFPVEPEPFALGVRDFPRRLAPPRRLFGRETEIAALRAAFARGIEGVARGVMVTGPPGVGKTALIDELRAVATASRGWFFTGKFDQYRHDVASDAVWQAIRALGRQLLTEPEAELVALRRKIQAALGSAVALIAAVLPEFGSLLGMASGAVADDVFKDDPSKTEGRLLQAGLDLLRAVASPARPLVMVVDDLQWAGAGPIAFIDAVLTDPRMRGLLLVGAYRESEVDAVHPLSAMFSRWERLGVTPLPLHLRNLPEADLADLLVGMLRLAPAEAAKLAEALGARTGGNPFDTVELVNSLRRDGVLELSDGGWEWDAAAIRRHIGEGDVVDILAARIARLPSESAALLGHMALLGGELAEGLLLSATKTSGAMLETLLAPAIEDGLVVWDDGAVRFTHDRVQQAVYGLLDSVARCELHLALARRLAGHPEYGDMAAAQYLPAAAAIVDAAERRRATVLFRGAAANSRLLNPAAAERFLGAAITLLSAVETSADAPFFVALETERHAALYRLGRLDEADEVYRSIERRSSEPLDLAGPARVQVSSLTNRGRPRDAVDLGLAVLRALGLAVPNPGDFATEVESRLKPFYQWVDDDDRATDLARPDASDRRAVAAGKLINRIMPPAFYCDQAVMNWLVTEAQRLWATAGPSSALVGPLSHAGFATIMLREDYATGYRAMRRVLAVGEARAYDISQARFMFSLGSGHWFEPLEDDIPQSQQAREGLIRRGDLQNACFTWFITLPAILECAPALETFAAESESALAFAERTGNHFSGASWFAYQQLGRTLTGETDGSVDEETRLAVLGANPTAAAIFHVTRALSGALFGNLADLVRHAAEATLLLPYIQATYPAVLCHFLQALALSQLLGTGVERERTGVAQELDEHLGWLAQRAADAPANFLHLVRLIEAERSRARGCFQEAISSFDAALRESELRHRPWHRALIMERAGLFYLSHRLEHAGRHFLVEARSHYASWGAVAKVREMEGKHSFLRAIPVATQQSDLHRGSSRVITADAIDSLAILRASQALSSETSLDGLTARVTELLGTMTGATRVSIAVWQDESKQWKLLPAPSGAGSREPIPIGEAAERGLLPLLAFSYVERSQEPLLVDDATRDERLARDPYFANLDQCSLLVVPILSQGLPRAVLILDNQLTRGAFSADRLDAVKLVAGQLAVSLDNALLYASLERKVAERTEALEETNRKLEKLSITDPLTNLPNKRRFAETLEAEWESAKRRGTSIGAAIADIDHFKLYNDHYGHLAGDTCLRRVATALSHSIREGPDMVARFGGEEFAFIFSGAGPAVVQEVAERARAAVAALNEPHSESACGIVTVSVGIAALVPGEADTLEGFLGAADQALYESKRNGRNRVTHFPADEAVTGTVRAA